MSDIIERAKQALEEVEYATRNWRNSKPGDDSATMHVIEVVEEGLTPLVPELVAKVEELRADLAELKAAGSDEWIEVHRLRMRDRAAVAAELDRIKAARDD